MYHRRLSMREKVNYYLTKFLRRIGIKTQNETYKHLISEEHTFNYFKKIGIQFNYEDGGIKIKTPSFSIALRDNISDKSVFNQIFRRQDYLPLAQIPSLNRIKVRTIVDIGANIG